MPEVKAGLPASLSWTLQALGCFEHLHRSKAMVSTQNCNAVLLSCVEDLSMGSSASRYPGYSGSLCGLALLGQTALCGRQKAAVLCRFPPAPGSAGAEVVPSGACCYGILQRKSFAGSIAPPEACAEADGRIWASEWRRQSLF